jgi:hypothetical protein
VSPVNKFFIGSFMGVIVKGNFEEHRAVIGVEFVKGVNV